MGGTTGQDLEILRGLLLDYELPRNAAHRVGLGPVALLRLLEGWHGKGWYEPGPAFDLGRLTDAGRAEARRRLGE